MTEKKLLHITHSGAFTKEFIDNLFTETERVRGQVNRRYMAPWYSGYSDRRAMLYFTQPSTRTYLSFLNACQLLSIKTSDVRDPATSSEIKGESLLDSIRTFAAYVDLIIMRSPIATLVQEAAELMDKIPEGVPIINAGSGMSDHPTQALLDVYTLEEGFKDRGGLEGKTIGMLGDLARGRTIQALCHLMRHYPDTHVVLISPPALRVTAHLTTMMIHNGISFSEHDRLLDVLHTLDAIYVTRHQSEYGNIDFPLEEYMIGRKELKVMKPDALIMHPLPRGPELSPEVDYDRRATYWKQSTNGLWLRMVLLMKVLRRKNHDESK